ncbi:hypothetical protein PMIN02_011147 [Paraphaeosphaeria minitans]
MVYYGLPHRPDPTYLEHPTLSLWIPVIGIQLRAFLQCRNHPAQIYKAALWSLLLTSLATSSVSMMSDWCGKESYIRWSILLHMVCQVPYLLNKMKLRRQEGRFFNNEARLGMDDYGSELEPEEGRAEFSWKQLAARSVHFHMVYNFIHVFWLRFVLSDGSYTTYINNSELLTMMLAAQLFLWSFSTESIRIRISDDETDSFEDMKVGVLQKRNGQVTRDGIP